MLWFKLFLYLIAALLVALAVGFLINAPWATWVWPFYGYRMSRIFIASILLAIAAPLVLIAVTDELAAVKGGAINLGVMFTIMAVYALSQGGSRAVAVFGWITAAIAVQQWGLFVFARRFDFRDQRPTPRIVTWSFGLFIVLLVGVGGALVFQVANILPWPVNGAVSAMYGAVFLGAACYFAFAVAVGVWGSARGPLLGFLAYDLVLIWPFLDMMPDATGRVRSSLIVYTAVLTYSGLLALFYLWRGPGTVGAATGDS